MMGGEVVVFWEGGVSLPLSPRPDFGKKGEGWKEDQLSRVRSPNNRRHFLILWWKGCEKRVSDVAIEITTQCYVLFATTLKSHLNIDNICFVVIAVAGERAVDVVRFERRNEGCKDQLAFWHWNKQQRIELSPATTVTLTPKTLVWDGSNNSQMMSKYYEAAVAAASCHCPSRHHPCRLSKFWDKRGNKRNNCRQWKDMQIDWDGRPSGWSWLPLYEFDDNDVAVWLAK